MKKVYVMVGAPASGKSTYVSENKKHSYIISSDDIRNMNSAWSDRFTKEQKERGSLTHTEVFDIMRNSLKMAVQDKSGFIDDIYYDATNTNRRRRRALYRNIKSWSKDVHVEIIFFSLPVLELIERNKKRVGIAKVPEHVIFRMHKNLQVPRIGVDCDEFEVIGTPIFKEVVDSVENPHSYYDLFDNVNGLNWRTELATTNVEHDCCYHLESIPEHINMCINNSDTSDLKQIALFHDLGKGITKKMNAEGVASYIGHAGVSAHYFLNYLALTKYKGDSIPEYELDLLCAIYQHMNFHGEMGKKNIKNNRLTKEVLSLGMRFSEIDSISRIKGAEN